MILNVFRDHRSRTHKGIPTYGCSTDDCAISSQRGPVLHQSWANLVHFAYFSPRVVDVSKNHPFQRSEIRGQRSEIIKKPESEVRGQKKTRDQNLRGRRSEPQNKTRGRRSEPQRPEKTEIRDQTIRKDPKDTGWDFLALIQAS